MVINMFFFIINNRRLFAPYQSKLNGKLKYKINVCTSFPFSRCCRCPWRGPLTRSARSTRGWRWRRHPCWRRGLALSRRRSRWRQELLNRTLVLSMFTVRRGTGRGGRAIHSISILTSPSVGGPWVFVHGLTLSGHCAKLFYNPTSELFRIVLLLIRVAGTGT